METPALFLLMIYLEHTEPEFSYGFRKLFLKMPHHFLVLVKLIKTRLLKIISKKISKSSFCRMNLGNVFLMSLLKMPFRRLWGSLFLLMLSHCQFLRRTLEFKFDAVVKKNIWNITLEIWGTKFLSICHKSGGFECHLFPLAYICQVVFFLGLLPLKAKWYSGLRGSRQCHCQIFLVLCFLAHGRITLPDSLLLMWGCLSLS